jgi:UDP-N-acetylglucosamine 2-epimerase (non-hydrolysing)
MAGRLTLVVGARPNFMKVAPVHAALRARAPDLDLRLVHTGQHYDPGMSDVFFDELELPQPDAFLGIGSGTHGVQTARALEALEADFAETRPDLVLVPGDVNSTLAGALAAVKLHIPVAHLEAGLRSFDPSMPEEHNRRLTDHVSSLLLTHSASAGDNLAREGIGPDGVHLVGNTMIDSLVRYLPAARARETWRDFGVGQGAFGLVTLHRPALVDDPEVLRRTVTGLCALGRVTPLVFPVHPRTHARLEQLGLLGALADDAVTVTEPLGYLDFLSLQADARFVLTDSGGVQEETTALGVRCFTLRDTTERPVTVELGTNTVLGALPERIAEVPALLEPTHPVEPVPLWDGHAGERAADVLAAFLSADSRPEALSA